METNQEIQKTSFTNEGPAHMVNAADELFAVTTSSRAEKEDEDLYMPFEEAKTNGSNDPIRLHPTVPIMMVSYEFNVKDLSPGIYYFVWSLSLAHIDSDVLKDVYLTSGRSPAEMSVSEDEAFAGSDFSTAKIKAIKHEGTQRKGGVVRIKMPLETWVETPADKLNATIVVIFQNEGLSETQVQGSYLEIFNIEVHGETSEEDDSEIILPDDSAIQHVRVCHKDPTDVSEAVHRPVRIDAKQVNDAGTHVATLSFTKTCAHIDLWTINDTIDIDHNIHYAPCASMSIPISRASDGSPPPLEIAISYDASRIAVFPSALLDRNKFPDAPPFQLLQHSSKFTPALLQHQQKLKEKTKTPAVSTPGTLSLSSKFRADKALRQFSGYGKFHFFDRDCNEVFIACDGLCVSVYSTLKRWSLMHTVPLTVPSDLELPSHGEQDEGKSQREVARTLKFIGESARVLIGSLEGPLCAWRRPREIDILDIQRATKMSHFVASHGTYNWVAFSPDRTMVIPISESSISTYMLYGNTLLSKSDLITSDKVAFVDRGRQLLRFSRGHKPFLLSPSNLTAIDRRVDIPISRASNLLVAHRRIRTTAIREDNAGNQIISGSLKSGHDNPLSAVPDVPIMDLILFSHGSRLSIHPLPPSVIYAEVFSETMFLSAQKPCDDDCRTGQNTVEQLQECTTPTGLKFRLEFHHTRSPFNTMLYDDEDRAVVLKMVEPASGSIPTRERIIQRTFHYYSDRRVKAYFLPCKTRYLVAGSFYYQIWKLPTEPNDPTCELMIMSSVQVGEKTWFSISLPTFEDKICRHGITLYNKAAGTHREISDDTLSTTARAEVCINSIPIMCALYRVADKDYKKALLKYALKYINVYPDPQDESRNVISRIVWSRANEKNYPEYDLFLKDLLAYNDPKPSWHPKAPYLTKKANPIHSLLETGQIWAKHIPVARILIDYCARTAKSSRDIGFLWPVIDCLTEMVKYHPDLALEVVRKAAFVPVNDLQRQVIVDSALVRPPPTIKNTWRRLVSSMPWSAPIPPTPVVRFKQPVFQVPSGFPSSQKYVDVIEENKNFTVEVYVAPFDLLWATQAIEGLVPKVGGESTWWRSIWGMLLLKTKPKAFRYIKTHKFEQEAFDNPALAAMVEYKWNTFACYYWLLRFVFQCLYYILILVVTLLQVYSDSTSLRGALLAIIPLSLVFLWLEFLQLMKEPLRYLSSPFNYVDLTVFALPLAASVVQLVEMAQPSDGNGGGNAQAFSYSILVIYLHLLFELRVIQSVCHFVTIILSVMRKIRIFFIIFAVAIFAFAHAFLHLLWANPREVDSQYPRNFGLALSATYFFMGGIYDPVSDKFGSRDAAFHIMMALYFFFTVILMLNVLIALINVAFTKGDDNWRLIWLENRLHYVASAENMSYYISGFRRTYDWFPRQIYYTATSKEVQDFNKKYFSDPEGSSDMLTAANNGKSLGGATTGVAVETSAPEKLEFVAMMDQTATATVATTKTSERTEEIDHRLVEMQKQFLEGIQTREEKMDRKYENLQVWLKEQLVQQQEAMQLRMKEQLDSQMKELIEVLRLEQNK